MHAAGIRHQDIKPDNIFLAELKGLDVKGAVGSEEGKQVLPVLLDLGVAAKEAELVLAGTPIYFAPEVAAQYARVEEPHPVTSAADVFSLCLSLRNALEPASREDVAAGAVERFIERRASTSPRPPHSRDLRYLKGHFERWLHLEPERRPKAEELAKELSMLTAPEERRARRLRFVRWFGPLAIAFVAIFFAVVYGLNRRAELQELETARARLEADRAQLEVAGMQEDLSAAAEREKSLEQDVAQTLERYRSSEMTREELTNKLARAEGESRMLRGMVSEEKRRSGLFKTELDSSVEENAKLTKRLARARESLDTERANVTKLTRNVETLDEELTQARAEAAEATLRADGLDGRVAALQEQLELEASASRRLEQELVDARQALETAQQAMARANRRVEQLERRLTALKRGSKATIPRRDGQTKLRDRPAPLPDSSASETQPTKSE
jgi:multidrug resistance efflux pump